VAEPLLESLRVKEIVVRASKVIRLGGQELSLFLLLKRRAGEGGQQASAGLGGDASGWMARRWPSLMGKG
jgi:hypothetical protein